MATSEDFQQTSLLQPGPVDRLDMQPRRPPFATANKLGIGCATITVGADIATSMLATLSRDKAAAVAGAIRKGALQSIGEENDKPRSPTQRPEPTGW